MRDRERRTTTEGRIPFVEDDELRGVDSVDPPGATFGLNVTSVVADLQLLVSQPGRDLQSQPLEPHEVIGALHDVDPVVVKHLVGTHAFPIITPRAVRRGDGHGDRNGGCYREGKPADRQSDPHGCHVNRMADLSSRVTQNLRGVPAAAELHHGRISADLAPRRSVLTS
jgi:hypothetical protein